MDAQNQKRRKCDKEEREGLLDCYKGIKAQLIEMNGTQKRHSRWFKDVYKRLRKVEDDDLFEDGKTEGKTLFKASTYKFIGIILTAFICLFAGIKTFQSSQKKLITILEDKKIDIITNDIDKITRIEDSIDLIKHLIAEGGG